MKPIKVLAFLVLFPVAVDCQTLQSLLGSIQYQEETSYNNNRLSDLKKLIGESKQTIKNDTLWLYTWKERHQWIEGQYVPQAYGIHDYYSDPEADGFRQIKKYVGINPEINDSTHKLFFFYDNFGRNNEIILQYYDTNNKKWDNYTHIKVDFDIYGYDSCTLYKSWDDANNSWVNSERMIMQRDSMEAIVLDVTEYWTGSQWKKSIGRSFTYFNNEYGCTDSLYFYHWNPTYNYWLLKRKWFLYYDENNVQIAGLETIYDETVNEWRNYQQSLDYKFDNWCGCYDFWKCVLNPTFFILQNWKDSVWVNMQRTTIEYDSLGGCNAVFEGHDGNDWYLAMRTELRFQWDGNVDFLLYYNWNGSEWVEYNGYKDIYTYVNDTAIECFNNKWDETIMDWGPHFYYKYKNYIGLPLVSSVIERQTLHTGAIRLAPNPARESFMVELLSETDYISEVEIIDQQGRIVFVSTPKQRDARTVRMDSSLLPSGLYIVRIKTNNHEVFHNKLIRK
jgi:hypothetical protein